MVPAIAIIIISGIVSFFIVNDLKNNKTKTGEKNQFK